MGIKTAGKTFDQLAAELGHEYGGCEQKWYTPAETAALMRLKLKETYPGIKAKVQTDVYSGGASVRVYWTGEYERSEVEATAESFRAGDFDGMTDSYSYRRNEMNGRPVHYGISYVFCYKAE